MRFTIDENPPAEIADDLRELGHDAETVASEGLVGASDARVRARAEAEARVILTMDKGIADIRDYRAGAAGGVVLFRPTTAGRGEVLTFVRKYLPAVLARELTGRIVVVTDRGIRAR